MGEWHEFVPPAAVLETYYRAILLVDVRPGRWVVDPHRCRSRSAWTGSPACSFIARISGLNARRADPGDGGNRAAEVRQPHVEAFRLFGGSAGSFGAGEQRWTALPRSEAAAAARHDPGHPPSSSTLDTTGLEAAGDPAPHAAKRKRGPAALILCRIAAPSPKALLERSLDCSAELGAANIVPHAGGCMAPGAAAFGP